MHTCTRAASDDVPAHTGQERGPKGLHRYDTFRKDAAHCVQCQEIWAFMKSRDEEELRRVVDHLAHHFQEELKVRLTA